MDEIIKMIQATIDKKGIQKNCRRLLKNTIFNPLKIQGILLNWQFGYIFMML